MRWNDPGDASWFATMPPMVGAVDSPVVVTGTGRNIGAGGNPTPMRAELRSADFTISLDGQLPVVAAYRDIATIAVDQGRVLFHISGGTRLMAEQLGAGLGTLVRELRERRARQMLTDRLIVLSAQDRLEMVEYSSAAEHGVGLLAFHSWGFALIPLDERHGWRLIRRAEIKNVQVEQSEGRLRVDSITFSGLGLDSIRLAQRFTGLRERALVDAAEIVNRLMPGAPLESRSLAASLLIDGRPISTQELGETAPDIERAVLADPTYATTYATLVHKATDPGVDAPRWVAIAPRRPGDTSEHMAWFLVGLPGGLLAMELVSEGAHATYLFRGRDSLESAVRDVSEFLIDARFLREPIYLDESALNEPQHMRYRLAIAALPSLRAARARFVDRLIHTDEEAWARSLDEHIQREVAA